MKNSYFRNTFISAALGSISLLSSGNAAPLVSIGDSLDVFFNGSFSTSYKTNLFNDEDQKRDDVIFQFSPGLEFKYGRNSSAEVVLRLREDILRYNDFTDQNVENDNVDLAVSYDSGPLRLKSAASYREVQQNSEQNNVQRTFVRQEKYDFRTDLEYDLTAKVFVESGFKWNKTKYTNNAQLGNALSGFDRYELPVNVLYRFSPKWALGGGYRVSYQDNDGTANRGPRTFLNNFFSVALRGEILPLLNANVNAGYQDRFISETTDGAGNSIKSQRTGAFSLNSRFDYSVTQKTTLNLGLNRDFGVGGTGGGREDTGISFGASSKLTQLWTIGSDFSFTYSEYDDNAREDKTTNTSVSAIYTPNNYLSFNGQVGYSNNDSNQANSSFSGRFVNLSASLRY